MSQDAQVFETHYRDYCRQLAKINLASIKDTLGFEVDNNQARIQLFDKEYRVSGNGITDLKGERPAYGICVILAKYILRCPDQHYYDPSWVSFKDFKKESHFTNVNVFSSDTEQAILKHFEGKTDALSKAGLSLGGFHQQQDLPYDLALQFNAFPRISLLLLFNDRDEEFPPQCKVLFQKHAEEYLDPESLIITSVTLAKKLVRKETQGRL